MLLELFTKFVSHRNVNVVVLPTWGVKQGHDLIAESWNFEVGRKLEFVLGGFGAAGFCVSYIFEHGQVGGFEKKQNKKRR